VVEALRFLVEEWLCDVAAGFAGRIVLLAYALAIIERVLLPERPAFFVTAGQRGGGKTTVGHHGRRGGAGPVPAGGAWSPAAEERRKALLAYLGEGVATVVWDNIERGAAISCPSIEKGADRGGVHRPSARCVRSATVPATTVQAFTGNNIAPRGDMASRSLVCRLEVERPDPENRAFRHPDPVGWTLDNRVRILRRPLHPAALEPAGPGVGGLSGPLQDAVQGVVGPGRRAARVRRVAGGRGAGRGRGGGSGGGGAVPLRPGAGGLRRLFAAGEVEEEETSGMRELVLLLRESFGDRSFFVRRLSRAGADLRGGRRAAPRRAEARLRATGGGGGRAGAGAAGRALEGTTARRCRRGRRPRRAWSASACRWWWGGRWRSVAAVARSGRWPRRTPATRPTPTGRRSCQRVAHERFRTRRPRGPARRIDPDFPGIPARRRERRGKPGVRRRPRRPELGDSGVSGVASDPADLLRRLRTRGAAACLPPGCLQPPPVRSVITR
jgi:hypothetical protein